MAHKRGADTQVCPVMAHRRGADTQVCPYELARLFNLRSLMNGFRRQGGKKFFRRLDGNQRASGVFLGQIGGVVFFYFGIGGRRGVRFGQAAKRAGRYGRTARFGFGALFDALRQGRQQFVLLR